MPRVNVQRKRCGAKKRDGEPCTNWAITGRERCRMHGGKAKRGVEVASFKHGKYSKYMPERVLARATAMVDDADLISMRDEIRVLDEMLIDAVERLDHGGSNALWLLLESAWRDFSKNKALASVDGMQEALHDIGALIEQGARDARAREEFKELVEQRRKVVETERKRLEAAERSLTVTQAMAFASALMAAVKEVDGDDPRRVLAINERFQQIYASIGATDGGGGGRP